MASKVNKKLVLILVLIVGVVGAGLGGLFFWKMRSDVTRIVQVGDDFMAAGNLDSAIGSYKRAVRRAPSVREYTDKLEAAYLQKVPISSDQAQELYRDYLAVLRHRSVHFPTQAEDHIRYLREIHEAALTSSASFWTLLHGASEDMLLNVPATDPLQAKGNLYRGIANLARMRELSPEKIAETRADLEVYTAAFPDDHHGWGSYVSFLLEQGFRLRTEASDAQAQKLFDEADAVLAQVPEGARGVQVMRVQTAWDAYRVRTKMDDTTEQDLRESMAGLLEQARESDEPRSVDAAAAVLIQIPGYGGFDMAVEALEPIAATHPDDLRLRFALAQAEFESARRMPRNSDEAREALSRADGILNELMSQPPKPVGTMSLIQFQVPIRAAALLVEVAFFRWDGAPVDQRPEQLVALEGAFDRLVEATENDADNPLRLRASGKIALANGDFNGAARAFEAFLDKTNAADNETLSYSAVALERIGQLGLAQERLDTAVRAQPFNLTAIIRKAQLEFRMGRYDLAEATARQGLEMDSEREPLLDIIRRVSLVQANDVSESTGSSGAGETGGRLDPLGTVLLAAQEAFDADDFENARKHLLEARQLAPRDVRVLRSLSLLEVKAGNNDAASEYVDAALEIAPENLQLLGMKAAIDDVDPIDIVTEYISRRYADDEQEREVLLTRNLWILYNSQMAEVKQAEADGNTADASEGRVAADRILAAYNEHRARADEIASDHPQLIEHRFTLALSDQDWEACERIVQRAAELNTDLVNGQLYRGRYHLIKGDYAEAVRILEQVTAEMSYSAVAWKGLGFAYMNTGNTPAAIQAYQRSYDCNPNDIDTINKYVRVLVQSGQPGRALPVIRTARKIAPDDINIRELWLQLEATAGDRVLALKNRREIYADKPDDLTNAMELANLLGSVEPGPGSILDKDGEPVYTANAWRDFTTAERETIMERVRGTWYAEADRILDESAEQLGEDFSVARTRAILLSNRKLIADGEAVLRDYINELPESDRTVDMYLTLGAYQAKFSRRNEAAKTFEEGRSLQTEDGREIDLALGSLYFEQGDMENAVTYLRQAYDDTGRRSVGLQAVEALNRVKKFDEASALLERVIDAGGRDYITWMLTATIADARAEALFASDGDAQADLYVIEREEALRRAEAIDPGKLDVDHMRVRSNLRQFRRENNLKLLDDALVILDHAESVRANDPQTSLLRVETLFARGENRRATGELTRVVEAVPFNNQLRGRLVEILAQQRNIDAAIQVVQAGTEILPNVPTWFEVLGDLYMQVKRDPDNAAIAYREAWTRDKKNQLLLARLVDAEMNRAKPDYQLLDELLARETQGEGTHPYLLALYGQSLSALARRDEALETMAESYRRYREWMADGRLAQTYIGEWYTILTRLYTREMAADAEAFVTNVAGGTLDSFDQRWLAQMWIASGSDGVSRAIELQKQAIQSATTTDPVELGALHAALGSYHIADGNYQAGAEGFERAIEINPEDPEARNNYAYIVAEHLDNPPGALDHALKAVELDSDNAAYADTLGWVYYRLGDTENARRNLLTAAELNEAPDILLHLAHVDVLMQDYDRAERNLRRASQLQPSSELQAQIDTLANEIRNR